MGNAPTITGRNKHLLREKTHPTTDEFLQSTLSELERDALNSTSLDDRVQHLMDTLRRKGVLPSSTTTGSEHLPSSKIFEAGIISTDKYNWCSPRSDQLLADLEAIEAFDGVSSKTTFSPRLRQLRDLSWAVRGVFWEDQVKRALLFSFFQRRWSNNAAIRTMSSKHVSNTGNLFTKSTRGGSKAADKATMLASAVAATTMLPLGFQGIPGTGLPPYARMCVQMVMQLATMQLSQMAQN